MTPPSTTRRFYWLDLFRLAAALLVVVVHVRGAVFVAYGTLPAEQKSLAVVAFYLLTRIGNEAVVAFFVLSGFFVGGRAFERIANGSFEPRDYAIDRFVRIMLPLLPALALTAAVLLIQNKLLAPAQFIGNVFALQGLFVDSYGGNAPLWSLAYEVWFYVLAGTLGIALARKGLQPASALVLLLVALAFTKLSPQYLFCWLIGAWAYLRRPNRGSTVLLIASVTMAVAGIAFIQLWTDQLAGPDAFQKMVRPWLPSDSASRLLLAAGVALLLQQLVLMPPHRPWARRLEAVGTAGAAFSYSLYLTHYPVIQAVLLLGSERGDFNLFSIGRFFALVAACVCVAWGVYWVSERHTARVRQWLKLRMTGAMPVAGNIAPGAGGVP